MMNVSDPLWFQCRALGDRVECHLKFSLLKPRILPALSWDGPDVFLGLLLLGKVSSGQLEVQAWNLWTFSRCVFVSVYICLSTDPSKKALLHWDILLWKQKAAKSWCRHGMSACIQRGRRALRMNLIHSLTQHHFWFKNQYLKTISVPLPSGCGLLLQMRPVIKRRKMRWESPIGQ